MKPETDKKTPKPQKFPKKNERQVKPSAESKPVFTKITSQFDTANLPKDAVQILNNFDEVIQGVRPLNSKQQQQLPDHIRQLSHQLTDQRSERRLGYMNDSIQLSSYVRYYTWWNLVRLTRLFANLPAELFPKENCVCLDCGSGPLTVVNALWLARPELRKLELTWYCIDVSANSMALGEDIFLSMAARMGETPWKIIRVKGSFGVSLRQKASFVTCANMLNELDQSSEMPPEFQTKKYYDQFKHYSTPDASFILIEPGVPKAARTLTLLRDRFIKDGFTVKAPCPHAESCPMNGFKSYTGSKNKWCNFAFTTDDAPAKLLKLSEKAKLPKERATLSFVAAAKNNNEKMTIDNGQLLCRIASDEFTLPGYAYGHYACTKMGLVLLRSKESGSVNSGDLILVKIKTPDLPIDEKSGAKVIKL